MPISTPEYRVCLLLYLERYEDSLEGRASRTLFFERFIKLYRPQRNPKDRSGGPNGGNEHTAKTLEQSIPDVVRDHGVRHVLLSDGTQITNKHGPRGKGVDRLDRFFREQRASLRSTYIDRCRRAYVGTQLENSPRPAGPSQVKQAPRATPLSESSPTESRLSADPVPLNHGSDAPPARSPPDLVTPKVTNSPEVPASAVKRFASGQQTALESVSHLLYESLALDKNATPGLVTPASTQLQVLYETAFGKECAILMTWSCTRSIDVVQSLIGSSLHSWALNELPQWSANPLVNLPSATHEHHANDFLHRLGKSLSILLCPQLID